MAEALFQRLAAEERRHALRAAQAECPHPAFVLEKDIWVVATLGVLFDAPFGYQLVFKGGTLRYASPEILSDRPAAEGDDVWSLCVVLYEMVSGEHPFAGGGRGAADAGDRIRGGDPSERRRGRRVGPLTRRPFGFRLSYVSIKKALDTAPLWGGAGRRCVSAEGSSASSRQQSGRRPVCGSSVVRPGGRHVSRHETV